MRQLAATAIAMLGVTACASAEQAAPDAGRTDARPAAADAPRGTPDARPGTPDATPGTPDATPSAAAHLLLTEVALSPNAGEMIEIVNPTGATVSLANYYVTDVPSYFRLPAGTHTIDQSDFIARFPAGATIAPGAVVTVSIDTVVNFTANYGVAPTYSLTETMVLLPTSGILNLTNLGEPVILFTWDGASDRVTDGDIVVVGVPSAGNALLDKSGVALDGPDGGTTTTAYAADAMTIPTTAAPGAAKSIKRVLPETGHELQSGGNGLGGADETSEQVGTTWDASSTYTAPTPGSTPL